MLYGQRIQQNEKEKRLRKSQLYREMLDNQIRLNTEYRQSHLESSALKQPNIPVQPKLPKQHLSHKFFQPTPPIQKKPNDLQTSFIYKLQKQPANSNSFLPLLKDSNKLVKGTSRFVKVEEPVRQRHRVEQVYTQMIEEQDNDDEYEQICEKIIRDLQDIKNKPLRGRNRRKIYDASAMHTRKHRLHTQPYQGQQQPYPNQEELYQNQQIANKSEVGYYQSLQPSKPQHETRYAKFVPTQSRAERERQEHNQFTNITLGDQSKVKRYLPALHQPHFSAGQDNLANTSKKDQNGRTMPNRSTNSKAAAYNSTSNQASIQRQRQSRANEASNQRFLQNRDRKNNNSVSYSRNQMEKKSQSSLGSTSTAKLQQRQNFLQLLRKVKNRGESLYLKLAKFPNQKTQKSSQHS